MEASVAVAAPWKFRGNESRRRRRCAVDISVETSRRRRCAVDIPWRRASRRRYYKDKFRRDLVQIIGDRTVELRDLVQEVARIRAPVLRMSTKVFLRTYPEIFLVETNLASTFSSVRLNKNYDPPLYI